MSSMEMGAGTAVPSTTSGPVLSDPTRLVSIPEQAAEVYHRQCELKGSLDQLEAILFGPCPVAEAEAPTGPGLQSFLEMTNALASENAGRLARFVGLLEGN